MSLPMFFSQLDGNMMTIFGIFITVWLTVHFSLFEAVGDLHAIRDRTICEIAGQQTNTELIRLFDTLRQKSFVLVLEPKRESKRLKIPLMLYAIAALPAICYKPISTYLTFLPDANYFYAAYIILLGWAASRLYDEVKYFREFRKLEREYPSSSLKPEKLHIKML